MRRTFEHVLKSNSKTFYIASKLLPKYIRNDVFKVYSFCRLYDDNVDLDRKDDTNDLEEYILKLGIDGSVIRELKNGINSDINHSGIDDVGDLLKYSYKVAGCVGLMMCDVLSIKDSLARYYAIDLGIAMQLTNICRDVFIDHRDGRIYLPSTMLNGNEISSMTDDEILKVVTKLILLMIIIIVHLTVLFTYQLDPDFQFFMLCGSIKLSGIKFFVRRINILKKR